MNFSMACFIGKSPFFRWQSTRMHRHTSRRPRDQRPGRREKPTGKNKLRFGANWRCRFFGLSLRCCGHRFWSELLPIAAFLDAGMQRADFASLFDDERRTALWTRLGDGRVRRGEIAVRIARAAIEHPRTSASTLTRAAALHQLAFVALRA